jgi:protocatechuate 3,4-dioxygenase beta subunit
MYTLVAMFNGLAPGIVEGVQVGESGPENPVSLSLSQGGTFEVRVSDGSGTPIAHARIELMDAGRRNVTRLYENLALMSGRPVETDDQGILKVEHVVPGVYFARVAPPLVGESEQVTVSEGQFTLVQIYGLEPGGS